MKFSNWTRWNNRNNLKDRKYPGVYMLAHFNNPPNRAGELLHQIIYIGETCNQTLRERLTQFNTSASLGAEGHSGGCNYFNTYEEIRDCLYVTVKPVKLHNKLSRSFFIRYAERKLLLEYYCKFKKGPECNKK